MSQQASFGRFGQLALTYCGKFLPLEVLHSAAGHYIGTRDTEGPVSRESREYFRSHAAAQRGPRKRRLVPARRSLIQLEESRHEPATAAGSRRSDRSGRTAFQRRAPAFFEAWKRGVEIAGPQWFGDGTREGLNQAKSKWGSAPRTCCASTTPSAS